MNNRDKYTDYDALPLVLEVRDIQSILGISRTTAYALVKQPDFPTFRSGNRIKISKQTWEYAGVFADIPAKQIHRKRKVSE